MKTDQMKLSDQEKLNIKELLNCLDTYRSELAEEIRSSLNSMVFENRYSLHPRRLMDLSFEEVDCFRSFIKDFQEVRVIERGKKLASEGLAERPLLSIGSILRNFLFNKMMGQDGVGIKTTLSIIDSYTNSSFYGYMAEREKQTLKDQEQLRKALLAALEKQRQELVIKNHAIHTSNNGIMLTDLEGKITYINPAFIKIWGFDNSAELLQTPSSPFLGDASFAEIYNSLLESIGWQLEFIAKRKDSSHFDVSISASLIRNNKFQPIGIMASFVNVTERKRLEAQFRQAQKMEALGQLAGGIVHDFNNLLQVISGYTELELMKLTKDSEHYENFMQIKIASDRGNDLTKQLRFFSRHSTGKKQSVDLNNVVKEIYNLLKHTFFPEINIKLQMDKNLRTVKADPSQMSQMLLNLCVNARDAIRNKAATSRLEAITNTGLGVVTIKTSNVDLDKRKAKQFLNGKPGKFVSIKVNDTGMGISPELIDRLFEPFFTTKGSKTGTGLGLAVVYGIVQNHNGFIDVRSAPGKGASFKILLPILEEQKEQRAKGKQDPNLVYGKGTVLVVEDEKQVRVLAQQALEISGYKVFFAEDGIQAVSLYQEIGNEIDLVILDMIMPKMGGWECFHKLKEINPEVKILIMTGYTTDGSAHDFYKEGALGIIEKPFDLEEFTQYVSKAINSI
jgi:PAS domain S-box-containing protein